MVKLIATIIGGLITIYLLRKKEKPEREINDLQKKFDKAITDGDIDSASIYVNDLLAKAKNRNTKRKRKNS